MPHVITQSCCNDGSCVFACPVNCIHPSPDEPAFATAEMLHIDPLACVDCGACVSACPVGAIVPVTHLQPQQLAFVGINASYYPERPAGVKIPPTSKLAPIIDAIPVRPQHVPLTVAIVGSGPAAMYAADELLTQPGVRVNVFEKLPTPYGLVRAGVAPDHQHTKQVTSFFDQVAGHRGFRFYLNVEIGNHLSHAELLRHHHAVIYAVGTPNDRRLDIEGVDLPGAGTATEMVAWINGHPDFASLAVDLSHERVVIIGNGNVAFDVARVLTADPDALAGTDISDQALQVLRGSAVREVVIAARRGPAHSAFTLPELIGLTNAAEVVLDTEDHQLVAADLASATDPALRAKLEILNKLGSADAPLTRPRIRLAYRLTPRRVLGTDRVSGIEFGVSGSEETRVIPVGLVLTSIGYRGEPVTDLPFDSSNGVVPNDDGRVIDPETGRRVPGVYVAGWIKRGPTGFIGTNKSCSLRTVQALVTDFNDRALADPDATGRQLAELVARRQPNTVYSEGWQAIDAAEIARGVRDGRPRDKFTDVAEMVAVARSAPPPRRRLRDRLRASL